MTAYYLDTSALVKRYTSKETGHAWMANICDPQQGNELIISEVAIVEAIATFCRMARENPPRLNGVERDQFIALYRQHIRHHYVIVRLIRAILTNASDECQRYPLRAYDAIQLASALRFRAKALAAGLASPIFVCADAILLAVAAAEGLPTENPNAHL